MITKLEISLDVPFRAAPWLTTSQLMKTHGGVVEFAIDRPNVLVGPNGAGKSALIETIALRFLAFLEGRSRFDLNYMRSNEARAWWTEGKGWYGKPHFLEGLSVEADAGLVRYYRPNHIPGNDDSVAAAMMCGYFEQARHYAKLTEDKSSGQKAQALQEEILGMLEGRGLPVPLCIPERWPQPGDLDSITIPDLYERQKAVLVDMMFGAATQASDAARPLILLDEPEQSLDALKEAQLWRAIAQADCTQCQVIVASHSLYPLMHPDQFNLIEAVPGYIEDVFALVR